jgi:CRISPR-associated protein Cas2
MWIFVLFDLPTDTKPARKAYQTFRKSLLEGGFTMLQYSVYARHCASDENAEVHEKRVRAFLPPDGEVRLMLVTDKQFERMKVFYGKIRQATEKAPEQTSFF